MRKLQKLCRGCNGINSDLFGMNWEDLVLEFLCKPTDSLHAFSFVWNWLRITVSEFSSFLSLFYIKYCITITIQNIILHVDILYIIVFIGNYFHFRQTLSVILKKIHDAALLLEFPPGLPSALASGSAHPASLHLSNTPQCDLQEWCYSTCTWGVVVTNVRFAGFAQISAEGKPRWLAPGSWWIRAAVAS